MEFLQQIQELAQKAKYEPYINPEQISAIELLSPSQYEYVDEEHPELFYYFNNFLLNGYSTCISTKIPFGIKVVMNNGKEYFLSGKTGIDLAYKLSVIGYTWSETLLGLLEDS
jgi:hypothetical protein